MSGQRVHHLAHTIEVAAPAGVVYALIADPERWPLYLPRNVYAQRLAFDGVHERLRVWALAQDQVISWTSERLQDLAGRCISFRQDLLMEPATSMAGRWQVTERAAGRCRLSVEHEFTTAPGRPQDGERLAELTAAGSRSALQGLQFLAERWHRLDQLTLSFAETLRVQGPPELVYHVLYDAARWPGRLPHVRGIALREPHAGIQQVTLDLAAADGTGRHSESGLRICFPHAGRIVHKATSPRPLLNAHCGEWSVLPDEHGVTVVAQHHVILCEESIEQVLGAGATLADARSRIRAQLGHESRQTLQLARRHAESSIHIL
ncbi:SRPBCC family protein [Streptomyces sp. NPDC046465]|uniref:aromatase/cyclase n=1 Tax=Streptomyces sp. NPDC046465 TaxID=3155810 RepID=UPI0033E7E991